MAANAGNENRIHIALITGLHCPHHVVAVENIDIFIDENNVLQLREGSESQQRGLPLATFVYGGAFLKLHHRQ